MTQQGKAPIVTLPIGYYTNLLTSEYAQASKFKQWLMVPLQILDDISNCLASISGAFDIDIAVGVQLDTLGILIGVSRTLPFQPSGGASPILSDSNYRLLLRATIAKNSWDGKIGSMYPIWNDLFPGGQITIIDNQNMSADIVLSGSFNSLVQDMITHDMIVPRPEAVQYNYLLGTLPYFGFDRNDSFIAGWDTGNWS